MSYDRRVADGNCFAADNWNDYEMNRERVELTATSMQKPNGNQYFAFSIMLDESFQSVSPTNTSLEQIHQRGDPTGTMQGLKSNPPII